MGKEYNKVSKEKEYYSGSPAFGGRTLESVRLDGDSARAIIEAAELFNRHGLHLRPFTMSGRGEEPLIRYALSLLAEKLEELESADAATLAEHAEHVREHLEPRTSRAQQVHAAKQVETARWVAEDEERKRRRREAEEAVREEEEAKEKAEREERVQEKLRETAV